MRRFRHSSQMTEDGDGQWIHITDHQAALNEVMKEAVWAMEQLANDWNSARAQAFLDSDRVREWRERQGKEPVSTEGV